MVSAAIRAHSSQWDVLQQPHDRHRENSLIPLQTGHLLRRAM
jgi:hypothetical protein